MTLEYASPEQVRGDPVTTSTDVYSLGVLLYRLLTGKSPYGPGRQSTETLRQAVCEKEPPRASTVVLTDDDTTVPDATQKLEAFGEPREKARRRLKKKLSGDLDTILLMALRKEPEHRYASVEQFSEDVRRYLQGRPVVARGGASAYRIGKFLRRNIAGVAIAVVLMLALAIAASVAAFYERAAERRDREAERQQMVLQKELLGTYLHSSDVGGLKRALEIAQALQRTQPESLTSRRDVMLAARRLGSAQEKSGDKLAALASFSLALQAAEKIPASDSEARRCLALSNLAAGEILVNNGESDAAVVKLRKAFEAYREIAAAEAVAPPSTATVDP